MTAIDQLFYAVKANAYPPILTLLNKQSFGFECVSIQELEWVKKHIPSCTPNRLLFTPNFVSKEEYIKALSLGCTLTLDNLYPLIHWPELFKDKPILLRIDLGTGRGHHKHVQTGGDTSKFGLHRGDISQAIELAKTHHISIMGLHAHSGSGILIPEVWEETARELCNMAKTIPSVQYINLGGGLGIVETPDQTPLDLQTFNQRLLPIKNAHPHLQFWLEPGRYLVAESGVLLATVTQTKLKGQCYYIGIETGMNSLIRPALYQAHHPIFNLTRLHEQPCIKANVVGPICESGDILGFDCALPHTQEGDVLLIANAGAYGHCMSSTYNLRPPASEMMYHEASIKPSL